MCMLLVTYSSLSAQANQEKFVNISRWEFKNMDIANDDLPKDYDLLLSRSGLSSTPILGPDLP